MYSIMYSVKHLTNSTKTYRGTYYIEDVDGNIVAHGSVGGNSHQRRVYLRKQLRDLNRKKCVLPNTINVEEEKVISQFIHDKTVSSTNNSNTDMDTNSRDIRKYVESKRKLPEPGDIIIAAELTLNGGSISFYQMMSLVSKSNINEKRNYFTARSLENVLIEPLGYQEIEPYNRQPPFYIGEGYCQLDKYNTEKFSVYTSELNPEHSECRSIHTSFDEFYYNSFWKSITIGLAINREDVSDFIMTLFGMMNFGDDVANIVDVYAEKLISTYVDKSELNKG